MKDLMTRDRNANDRKRNKIERGKHNILFVFAVSYYISPSQIPAQQKSSSETK